MIKTTPAARFLIYEKRTHFAWKNKEKNFIWKRKPARSWKIEYRLNRDKYEHGFGMLPSDDWNKFKGPLNSEDANRMCSKKPIEWCNASLKSWNNFTVLSSLPSWCLSSYTILSRHLRQIDNFQHRSALPLYMQFTKKNLNIWHAFSS